MRYSCISLIVAGLLHIAPAAAASNAGFDKAMTGTDWMGTPVTSSWWSLDGKSLYFTQRDPGTVVLVTYQLDPLTGTVTRLSGDDAATVEPDGLVRSPDGTAGVLVGTDGDVYVMGKIGGLDGLIGRHRVTATAEAETDVGFAMNGRPLYLRAGVWYSWDPATRSETPLLRIESKPEGAAPAGKGEAVTVSLGPSLNIISTSLSPTGRFAAAITEPGNFDRGRDVGMPDYITESGYPEMVVETGFPRIGRNAEPPQALWFIDVEKGAAYSVDLSVLPDILDDPLADLRRKARLPSLSGARSVSIGSMKWKPDGSKLVVGIMSRDGRDVWLAEFDTATRRIAVVSRETSSARALSSAGYSFDYLPDGRFWFQSERSDGTGLYMSDGQTQWPVAAGRFDAGNFNFTRDGRRVYFRCNAESPVDYEICVASTDGSGFKVLTRMDGVGAPLDFFPVSLSPDETRIAVRYSGSFMPVQLAAVDAESGDVLAHTDTRSEEFKALKLPEPELVEIPISTSAQKMWGKLWGPEKREPGRLYPILLILHGGNTYQAIGKFMPSSFQAASFAQHMAAKGYLVLEFDYRGSIGYGEAWRNAVYRKLGFAEVQDMRDAVDWLVKHRQGDGDRAGVQGCSYGGYLAYMAAFLAPELFKASAAWNGFADWTRTFSSNSGMLLDDPNLNPQSFKDSSATSHVEAFDGNLLIVHAIDDQVILFEHAVAVAQRLLELDKKNWELATYPEGGHCFGGKREFADDAYRRTIDLFDRILAP
jgi:dipeptidyl aminopeptidase/acylaminoacyl peptidase